MRFTVIAAQALALGLAAAAPAIDKRGNCDKSATTSSSSSAVKAGSSSSSSSAAKVATTNVAAAAVVSAASSSSSTTSSSAAAAVVAATTTSSSSTSVVTPTIVPSVGSYTYQLCAAEPEVNGISTRLLTGQQEQGQSAMTVESCASWCSGYTYFGLEYGQECYCGNTITTGTTVDTTNGCNMVCDGNSGEYCGGSWRMQLYALGSAGSVTLPSTYSASAATATATATGSGSGSGSGTATTTAAVSAATATGASSLTGWESVGCVIEPFDNGGSGRGLTGQSTSGSAMSLEACATFCTGWDYFGVEYADECYCGDALTANTAWDLLQCADPCAGNSAEICGGSGHFNLYQLSNMTLVTLPTYGVATTTASSATATASVAAASVSTTAASISSTSVGAVASVASTVVAAVAVPVSTSKTSVASTLSTVVSVASASASAAKASASAASATASTCAPPTSTAVSSLSSTFLNTKYTFNHYFSGSSCTLNTANPGNTLPSLLPPVTLAISGSNAVGTAASTCIAKAGILSLVYQSFDLHYRTDTCAWECVMYPGTNTVSSYFNVQNSAISQTHGYSC